MGQTVFTADVLGLSATSKSSVSKVMKHERSYERAA